MLILVRMLRACTGRVPALQSLHVENGRTRAKIPKQPFPTARREGAGSHTDTFDLLMEQGTGDQAGPMLWYLTGGQSPASLQCYYGPLHSLLKASRSAKQNSPVLIML